MIFINTFKLCDCVNIFTWIISSKAVDVLEGFAFKHGGGFSSSSTASINKGIDSAVVGLLVITRG